MKNKSVETESLAVSSDGDDANFDLKSFSVVIGIANDMGSLSTTITEIGNDSNSVDLSTDGQNTMTSKFDARFRLDIKAVFSAGTNKKIEIKLPEGMSYSVSGYQLTWDTDVMNYSEQWYTQAVSELITPYKQTEESKKPTVLNYNYGNGDEKFTLSNGTLTFLLKEGVESINFSIRIAASSDSYYFPGFNYKYFLNQKYIENAVEVSQSYVPYNEGSEKININRLDRLDLTGTPDYNIGVSEYKKLYDRDSIPVSAGGDSGYSVRWFAGYKFSKRLYRSLVSDYYIRIKVPKDVTFKEIHNADKDKFFGALFGTPTRIEAGEKYTTSNGAEETVESGFAVYTFRTGGIIELPYDMEWYSNLSIFAFDPVWNFSESIEKGTELELKIVDVGIKFARFKDGKTVDQNSYGYENIDPKLYENAKVKYKVEEPSENVYVQDRYFTYFKDNIIKMSPVYMGAPGFEYTQESPLGYFKVGNRGLKNSVAKTIKLSYDTKNSGKIGVTSQLLPGNWFENTDDDFRNSEIKKIQYKLWTPGKPDSITEWKTYDGSIDNGIRNIDNTYYKYSRYGYVLTIDNVKHDEGQYFKEIKYDIDTIPKSSMLGTKGVLSNEDEGYYIYDSKYIDIRNFYFFGNVLTNGEVASNGDISSEITVEDKEESNKSATGYIYTALTGKSLMPRIKGGTRQRTHNVLIGKINKLNAYINGSGGSDNAGIVNKAWLVSPNGTEIKNLRVISSPFRGKIFDEKANDVIDITKDLKIREVKDRSILDKLRGRPNYENSRIWEIDFTGIDEKDPKFFSHRVLGPMYQTVNRSKSNIPSSYAGYDFSVGVITFSYEQETLPTEPINIETDPLLWVEMNTTPSENYVKDKTINLSYPDIHKIGEYPSYFIGYTEDIYGLLKGNGNTLYANSTYTTYPSESIVLDNGLKEEHMDTYKVYDTEHQDDATILGLGFDLDTEAIKSNIKVNYKVAMQNFTGSSVEGLDVYFPIPKKDQNWGSYINPRSEGFSFDMNLLAPIEEGNGDGGENTLPGGFHIEYLQNATPSGSYLDWIANDDGKAEEEILSGISKELPPDEYRKKMEEEFKKVNFVHIYTNNTLENGYNKSFNFDMDANFDNNQAKPGYLDMWSNAFRTTARDKTKTWGKGSTVAAGITEGRLKGKVWFDRNKNGQIDKNEESISDAEVKVYSINSETKSNLNLIKTGTTDKDGNFEFKGLWESKDYRLTVTKPNGYKEFTIIPNTESITSTYNYVDADGNALAEKLKGEKILNAGLLKPEHTVTYSYKGDTPENITPPPASTVYTGDSVSVASISSKAGYKFSGWSVKSPNNLNISGGSFVMPDSNVEIEGTWEKNKTANYTVKKIYESAAEVFTEKDEYVESETRSGNTDFTVSVEESDKTTTRDGYIFDEKNDGNVTSATLNADGTTVLLIYFKKATPKTSITVTKKWIKESNGSELGSGEVPNKDIKVALYRDGELVKDKYFTLNKSNSWTQTIDNLDKAKDGFSKDYVYTVKELNSSGNALENGKLFSIDNKWYSPDVKNNNGTFTVTNKLYDKTYKARYIYSGTVPANAPIIPDEKSYGINASVNIEPNPTLENYTFSGWEIVSPDDLTKDKDKNSFTMPTGDVLIEGTWNGIGNVKYVVEKIYETSPNVFDVVNPEKKEYRGYAGDTAKVSEDDKKPSKEKSGYVFDESNKNNKLVGTIAKDGSLVLKVYFKKEIPKTSVSVSKVCKNYDKNDMDPDLVAGYLVKAELYRRDTSDENSKPVKIDERILTSSSDEKLNWKAVFEGLDAAKDAFTNKGYEYTIKEARVSYSGKITFGSEKYTSKITGDAKSGFVITNTKDKTTTDVDTGTDPEKINIKVEKKWVGEAKDSITVRLYADGKEIKEAKISAKEGWKYEFKELPKYSNQAKGTEIKYTVKEDKVEGYTTTITGGATDGFVITNTKVKTTPNNPNPEKPDKPVNTGGGTTTATGGNGSTQTTTTTESSTSSGKGGKSAAPYTGDSTGYLAIFAMIVSGVVIFLGRKSRSKR